MRKRILGETVTPISGEWGSGDGEVKVLRSTNFTNEGHVDYNKIACREVEPDKVRRKRLSVGDVLIEKSGGSPTQPVGRVVYFESQGEFLTSNFLSALRVHDNEVHSKYLFYWLFSGYSRGLTKPFQNKTTGIINLQLKRFLQEIEFPLPPLEEQKRIAGILDEADLVRKKTQALIDKYDELAQSLFLDMFGDPVTNPKGWEMKPLSEFIAKLRSGVSVNSTKDDRGEDFSSPRVLKTSCVTMGFFKPSESKAIVSNEVSRVKLFAEKNTIIISRMNTKDLVAKSAYVSETFDMHFLPDRLWMTQKGTIPHNVKWLSFALGQERFRVEISKSASGTSGSMKNVSQSNFLKALMIYPPVESQIEFVQKLQSAEHLKDIQMRSFKEAEELFSTLLQKAFKGELT